MCQMERFIDMEHSLCAGMLLVLSSYTANEYSIYRLCIIIKTFKFLFQEDFETVKPGFHYTANATTTTQKQSDYRVEQSYFKLIALL